MNAQKQNGKQIFLTGEYKELFSIFYLVDGLTGN